MASISRDPNGRRRILFVAVDGSRKTIRLGKTSQRIADEIKTKVEALSAAAIAGHSVDSETASWLTRIGDDLAQKLATVGLVSARHHKKLGAFLGDFLGKREGMKPNTMKNFEQA